MILESLTIYNLVGLASLIVFLAGYFTVRINRDLFDFNKDNLSTANKRLSIPDEFSRLEEETKVSNVVDTREESLVSGNFQSNGNKVLLLVKEFESMMKSVKTSINQYLKLKDQINEIYFSIIINNNESQDAQNTIRHLEFVNKSSNETKNNEFDQQQGKIEMLKGDSNEPIETNKGICETLKKKISKLSSSLITYNDEDINTSINIPIVRQETISRELQSFLQFYYDIINDELKEFNKTMEKVMKEISEIQRIILTSKTEVRNLEIFKLNIATLSDVMVNQEPRINAFKRDRTFILLIFNYITRLINNIKENKANTDNFKMIAKQILELLGAIREFRCLNGNESLKKDESIGPIEGEMVVNKRK